ncbi:MAG: hypothetical protein L0Y44_15935 [Phycisphaerales bacterium]|nr:hypothetical protein [Phycisphaerales bacterium]MCI0676063.1 hypothetical protein [Phycisphaerales bacterium]
MEGMQFVILALLIGGAIAVGILAHLANRKRQEELAKLASELGWQFEPGKDKSHDEEYAHFEIFRRGHSRAAYNTLTGELAIAGRGYPAKMGDFTYQVTQHTGKSTSTQTYRFSYLIVHLPFGQVPNLLIRREGIFDKLAGALGFDDIDFESAEFSKKFHVKSPDKRFAYDVCHPRMMEFLLQSTPPMIDIENGRCCLSDGSQRWEPEQFKAMLNWIERFFDLWPEHVTAELEA